MKQILRSAGEQFEILERTDSIVKLDTVDKAHLFLQKFVADPMQMESLREVASKSIAGLQRMSDHEVIRLLASEVAHGNVQFLKRGNTFSARNSRLMEDDSATEGTIPPQTQAEEKKKTAWIEIKLIDMNGDPIPNEKYKLELPDGSIKEGKLDERGMARETGIEPGSAKVSFPDLDKDAWEAA